MSSAEPAARRRDCRVVAPTEAVPNDQPFDLVVEIELVNNSLVCHCVSVAIRIGGERVNTVTVPVGVGGGLNPTTVQVTTPLRAPADNASLPTTGQPNVTTEIVSDEAGCGTRAAECEPAVEAGEVRFV